MMGERQWPPEPEAVGRESRIARFLSLFDLPASHIARSQDVGAKT